MEKAIEFLKSQLGNLERYLVTEKEYILDQEKLLAKNKENVSELLNEINEVKEAIRVLEATGNE